MKIPIALGIAAVLLISGCVQVPIEDISQLPIEKPAEKATLRCELGDTGCQDKVEEYVRDCIPVMISVSPYEGTELTYNISRSIANCLIDIKFRMANGTEIDAGECTVPMREIPIEETDMRFWCTLIEELPVAPPAEAEVDEVIEEEIEGMVVGEVENAAIAIKEINYYWSSYSGQGNIYDITFIVTNLDNRSYLMPAYHLDIETVGGYSIFSGELISDLMVPPGETEEERVWLSFETDRGGICYATVKLKNNGTEEYIASKTLEFELK